MLVEPFRGPSLLALPLEGAPRTAAPLEGAPLAEEPLSADVPLLPTVLLGDALGTAAPLEGVPLAENPPSATPGDVMVAGPFTDGPALPSRAPAPFLLWLVRPLTLGAAAPLLPF